MLNRLALPIRVAANGRLAAVTVDSDADITQSVALLVATRPGERRSVEDYGLPDPLFGGLDVDEIAETIATWEERADPTSIDQLATSIVEQSAQLFPAEQPDLEEA